MKIMILTNNDFGLYKFRRELLEELVRDNKVYICLPNGPFINDLKSIGCKFIACDPLECRGKNPFKDLQLLDFYQRVLKKIKPDIVFTYTIKPNVYGGMSCAKLGIPYVVNVTGLGTAIENGGLTQAIGLALYRIGARKAQKVFFQNRENMDFMVGRRVIKRPHDLLPGSGVNLNQYQVSPYPEGEIVHFAFVARVMKEKGIDQYLDAAREIRKRNPNTRFHICGVCDPGYADVLKQFCDDGTIIYHGLVPDIRSIYQMISCTVHPTYYPEGMSNVLLESSASGRPIITTNRAGCREIIEDGVNGFVVKQRDSKDLIDKIEKFLNLSADERKQMGLNGRAAVERKFDRRIVVRKYLDEVEKVRK